MSKNSPNPKTATEKSLDESLAELEIKADLWQGIVTHPNFIRPMKDLIAALQLCRKQREELAELMDLQKEIRLRIIGYNDQALAELLTEGNPSETSTKGTK
jgi:undecaprenyl pyrophosphate synthase